MGDTCACSRPCASFAEHECKLRRAIGLHRAGCEWCGCQQVFELRSADGLEGVFTTMEEAESYAGELLDRLGVAAEVFEVSR